MKLKSSDVQEIENAVKNIESRSLGEIVPIIVSHCHHYRESGLFVALIFGLIGQVLALYSASQFTILFSPILMLVGYVLGNTPALKRFICKEEMAFEMHQKLCQAFLNCNLHRTTYGTGIIVMISLLEQRVEIIGDWGINEKISPEFWNQINHKIIERIKQNKLTLGMVEGIESVGEVLIQHFPAKADNPNEIKNNLITDLKIEN